MSSQWVDASGIRWRYSTVSKSWQRLVDGTWMVATPPAGGLQRVSTSGGRDVVTAPLWPADQDCPPDAQWIDEHGDLWRYSSGRWQHYINGVWNNASPPSGGLKKLNADEDPGQVIVVELRGPEGPEGPPGPPGIPGIWVSEVLPAQSQNGVNVTFALSSQADLGQAFQVFRNGLMEMPGYSYQATPTFLTFTTPPLDSDVLLVIYQKAQ
jgi:hypothetical protein